MASGCLRYKPKGSGWMVVKADYLTGSGTKSQIMLVEGGKPKTMMTTPPKSLLSRVGLRTDDGALLHPDPIDDGFDDIMAVIEQLSENDNGTTPNLMERINMAVDIVDAQWFRKGRELFRRWIY